LNEPDQVRSSCGIVHRPWSGDPADWAKGLLAAFGAIALVALVAAMARANGIGLGDPRVRMAIAAGIGILAAAIVGSAVRQARRRRHGQ
jgi:hypothetical protein